MDMCGRVRATARVRDVAVLFLRNDDIASVVLVAGGKVQVGAGRVLTFRSPAARGCVWRRAQNRLGVFSHDAMIGKEYGSRVRCMSAIAARVFNRARGCRCMM